MTITAIRKKLMTYLADADDEKVKALYTILSTELDKENSFALTEDHISILAERREAYMTGKSKGKSWQEAHKNIRTNYFNNIN